MSVGFHALAKKRRTGPLLVVLVLVLPGPAAPSAATPRVGRACPTTSAVSFILGASATRWTPVLGMAENSAPRRPGTRHCRARPSHQAARRRRTGTGPRLRGARVRAGVRRSSRPVGHGNDVEVTEVLYAPRAARPIFIVAQRPADSRPGSSAQNPSSSAASGDPPRRARPRRSRRITLTAVAARFAHRAIGPAATASTPSSFGTHHASSFVY